MNGAFKTDRRYASQRSKARRSIIEDRKRSLSYGENEIHYSNERDRNETLNKNSNDELDPEKISRPTYSRRRSLSAGAPFLNEENEFIDMNKNEIPVVTKTESSNLNSSEKIVLREYPIAGTFLWNLLKPNKKRLRYSILISFFGISPFIWKYLVGFFAAALVLALSNFLFPPKNHFKEVDVLKSVKVELLEGRVNLDVADVEYHIKCTVGIYVIETWHYFKDFQELQSALNTSLISLNEKDWNILQRVTPDSLALRKDNLRLFLTKLVANESLISRKETLEFLGISHLLHKSVFINQNKNSFEKSKSMKSSQGNEENDEYVDEVKSMWWSKAFSDAPPETKNFYSDEGPFNSFQMRGAKYFDDKIKMNTGPALMILMHMDVFNVDTCCYHIASKGKCSKRLKELERISNEKGKKVPFLFLLNIQVPGDPLKSIVFWWALSEELLDNEPQNEDSKTKFMDLLSKYAEVPGSGFKGLERNKENINHLKEGEITLGDGILPIGDFRNERFKLLPCIVEGPFLVKQAVGKKPALLGRKLTQRYFRGKNYIETDVDVASSNIAARIVGICRGVSASLTVDIGITLEGRSEDELPERCLGVARLHNLDLNCAEDLE